MNLSATSDGFYNNYVPASTLLSRPTPRRCKKLVPDSDKDDRYWEKRKRNNDAARRSRENKRRLDLDIRGRVVYLEENIASLRKELLVIKTKYKLPLDQTFTRIDEHGELVGQPARHRRFSSDSMEDYQANTDDIISCQSPTSPLNSSQGSYSTVLNGSSMNGGSLIAENHSSLQRQLSEEMIPVKKRRPTIKEEQMEMESQNDLGTSPGATLRANQGTSQMSAFYTGFPGQMMWPASVNAAVQAAAAQAQAQQYYAAEAAVRQLANTAAVAGSLPTSMIPTTYPGEESLSNHLPPITNTFRSDRNLADSRGQQNDEASSSSGYSSHGSNSPLGTTTQISNYSTPRNGSATLMLPPDVDIPMHVDGQLEDKGAKDLSIKSHQTLEAEVAKSVSRAFQMNIDEHKDTGSSYDSTNQRLYESKENNEQRENTNQHQRASPNNDQINLRQSPSHNQDRFKRGLKHHLLAHQDNVVTETPSVPPSGSSDSSPSPQSSPQASPSPQSPPLPQSPTSPRPTVHPITRELPAHVPQSHAVAEASHEISGQQISHLGNNNALIAKNNCDITSGGNTLRQEQIACYENSDDKNDNNDIPNNQENDLTKQENKDLRQQLLALSAEVAKMRSIVLGN